MDLSVAAIADEGLVGVVVATAERTALGPRHSRQQRLVCTEYGADDKKKE